MKSPSMRRALVVIGPVLGLLAVASCGGGSSNANTNAGAGKGTVADPTKPVTITFESWVGQDPSMKKLAADFHKLHPTITIKFLNSTADAASQKLTTQIAGGEPPDTAYINASDTSDFGSRGALVNLDNYMSRSKIVHASDYVPAFKTFVTYNNHFYGLPFDGESTGLFYRTDLFKAAGITKPPTTWAQFKADAQKLTIPAKKQYGFAEFTQEAAYYWYPWLYQAGGDLLSKDGKSVVFDSPQAKTAANFYVGLAKYSPPNLNSNSYDGRTAFAQRSGCDVHRRVLAGRHLDVGVPEDQRQVGDRPAPERDRRMQDDASLATRWSSCPARRTPTPLGSGSSTCPPRRTLRCGTTVAPARNCRPPSPCSTHRRSPRPSPTSWASPS